jgi:transposase
MSIVDEMEIMTGSMSPKFMADIQKKLEGAIAYPSLMTIRELKSEINEFIWAVRTMGDDILEGSLNDLLGILDDPGDKRKNLSKLLEKFKELNENIPTLEPGIDKVEDIQEKIDKPISEESIDKFLMIPGIGRERAMTLIEEGFDSIEALSKAPLARITMVTGISLSLAKEIADFLNPNRLHGMERLPKTLGPSHSSEEISFMSKPFVDKNSESNIMAETYEDDPELLKIYLVRLKKFLDEDAQILDTLSTSPSPEKIISNLEDSSTSLLNVTRYMGLDLIESELSNIANISNEVLLGKIELSETTVFAIKQARAGLEYGLEKLNALLGTTAEQDDIYEEIAQEDTQALHKHINEIHHLYKDVGEILEKALKSGMLDKKEIEELKENTALLIEMTGSLTKNSDDQQED